MNQEINTQVSTKKHNIFGTVNPQKIVKLILNKWYWYLITIVTPAEGVLKSALKMQ